MKRNPENIYQTYWINVMFKTIKKAVKIIKTDFQVEQEDENGKKKINFMFTSQKEKKERE